MTPTDRRIMREIAESILMLLHREIEAAKHSGDKKWEEALTRRADRLHVSLGG